jgi:2-polyprenyl-6-methoxyphenol hydroxylase-like FAD-dependent oxidoreductase
MGQKIVIIGAGLAGLTAAVALARKGLEAEVHEQAPELKEVGAGVGLWGNAFRALEAIGLAGDVERLAGGFAGSRRARRAGPGHAALGPATSARSGGRPAVGHPARHAWRRLNAGQASAYQVVRRQPGGGVAWRTE